MMGLVESKEILEKLAKGLVGAMRGVEGWEEAWAEWIFFESGDGYNQNVGYRVGEELKQFSLEQMIYLTKLEENPAKLLAELRDGFPEDKKFKKLKLIIERDGKFRTEFGY